MSARSAEQQRAPRQRWPALMAVAVPLVVYLAVVAWGYDGRTYLRGDSAYYYLTALSLLHDRDLDLGNQLAAEPSRHAGDVSLDRRGRLVPKHPILLPLVSLPLVGTFGPPGALTFNLVQLGVLAGLLYALARRVTRPWPAAGAAAITGAASLLPHYAWSYSPDVLSTALLVATVVTILPRAAPAAPRRIVAAGFLLGLAVASKLPLLVTVPFFLSLLPRPLALRLVPFVLGLALPLLLLAAYNTHLFGAPWVTSYDRVAVWSEAGVQTSSQRRDFGEPMGVGLFRLLVDRHHGLLPTSPITVLALAAFPLLWSRSRHLATLAGGSAAALLVFFSTYRLWDHSHYGNRFLLPIVALAVLPLAPALEAAGGRLRRWWARRRASPPTRTDLAFALVVVLQLVPVWAVPYLPTQDGPAHLGNAALLLDLHRQDRPFLRQLYELNPQAGATWGSHLALAALTSWVPPPAAEKLFLTAYLVLLPLAVRYALRAIRPGAQELAFLALPLSASYLFHMGFQSFCWSLVVTCVLLGYWLGRDGELALGRERLTFAGLGALLWLAHPVSLLAAVASVAAAGIWLAVREHGAGEAAEGREGLSRRCRRRVGIPLLALVPASTLLAVFALQHPDGAIRWLPLGQRLRSLATLDVLVSFDPRELWLSSAMAALVVSVSAAVLWSKRRRPSWSRADALLPAVLALVLLYLVAPNTLSGGGWISHRLMLLALLLVVVWLGAQPLARGLRSVCQLMPALLALGLMTLHYARYSEISGYLEEYVGIMGQGWVGATWLSVTPLPWGVTPDGRLLSSRVQPFAHAAGYHAAESESAVLLLDNYQAAKGHFPVRYLEPLGALAAGGPEGIPPAPQDLLPHLERSGVPVDLVLLWGFSPEVQRLPGYRALLEQLETSYRLVALSTPTGLGRLYLAGRLVPGLGSSPGSGGPDRGRDAPGQSPSHAHDPAE